MILLQPPDDGTAIERLSDSEQARLGPLLGDVGTRTLLHSLAGLQRDSADARLIIAVLLERLAPDDRDRAPASGA